VTVPLQRCDNDSARDAIYGPAWGTRQRYRAEIGDVIAFLTLTDGYRD
jgi:hypothetical protein